MLTYFILVVMIISFLGYLIYTQWVVHYFYGKTLYRFTLKKRQWIDGVIIVGLLAILYYVALVNHSNMLTKGLLAALLVLCIYQFLWQPKMLLLKDKGIIYGGVLIPYGRVKAIFISEDQGIALQLEQRSLVIWLKNPCQIEVLTTLITHLALK